jgi:hypothetical protein
LFSESNGQNLKTKKISIMHTYKVSFDNGLFFKIKMQNLDKVHESVVFFMEKGDFKECTIICDNGIFRRVRKTGETHFKHNGFSFD